MGRIMPVGVVTEFKLLTRGADPISITAGPDGNLWFSSANTNRVGRITELKKRCSRTRADGIHVGFDRLCQNKPTQF